MHRISKHIKDYYDRLYAERATQCRAIPIHQGKELAGHLQYPIEVLADLPRDTWDHFLPCGNPLRHLRPTPGEKILNLGSGIGVDSLALARACGVSLTIVNTDIVAAVLSKSRAVARELGFTGPESSECGISWVCGDGEHLPFRWDTFDWVVMNGVFNLFPDKPQLLAELRDVLKVRGRLLVTDLCAETALPDYFHEEMDAWAWCMSGACSKEHLTEMLETAGYSPMLFSEDESPDMLFRMSFIAQKTG